MLSGVPGHENREGAALAGRMPASSLAGGVGEVGGKLEGLEGYLLVVAVGVGMAGGGGAAGSGGRRWWLAAAAAHQ